MSATKKANKIIQVGMIITAIRANTMIAKSFILFLFDYNVTRYTDKLSRCIIHEVIAIGMLLVVNIARWMPDLYSNAATIEGDLMMRSDWSKFCSIGGSTTGKEIESNKKKDSY